MRKRATFLLYSQLFQFYLNLVTLKMLNNGHLLFDRNVPCTAFICLFQFKKKENLILKKSKTREFPDTNTP